MFDELKDLLAREGVMTFHVKVRPNASKTQLKGQLADGTYKMDVAAVPEDGKANIELIEFLSHACNVSRAEIEILSGETSPRKKIRIKRTRL